MTNENPIAPPPDRVGPTPKHQLAVMIWLAVVPTLIVLQLLLRGVLDGAPMILRTLALSSLAVPIVVYGLMPPLQRLRLHLLTPGQDVMPADRSTPSVSPDAVANTGEAQPSR